MRRPFLLALTVGVLVLTVMAGVVVHSVRGRTGRSAAGLTHAAAERAGRSPSCSVTDLGRPLPVEDGHRWRPRWAACLRDLAVVAGVATTAGYRIAWERRTSGHWRVAGTGNGSCALPSAGSCRGGDVGSLPPDTVARTLSRTAGLRITTDGDVLPPVDPDAFTLGEPVRVDDSGFGLVEPPQLFLGGDPTGLVKDIRWSSWGGPRAVGHGRALYVTGTQSVAAAPYRRVRIVAFDVGPCKGQTAYRKVTWYFPQYGQEFDGSGGDLGLCETRSP